MTKIISFIGAPGCGKGFLIKHFVDRLSEQKPELNSQMEIISIGDMIRQEIKQQTALGKQIQESKQSGCLAPDTLINPLLQKRLYKSKASIIILDGYPRNEEQLKILNEITENQNLSIVYRETSENIIRQRISSRRICANCGSDHTADEGSCHCGGELIKRKDDEFWEDRMSEYKHVTLPMIEQLKNKDNFYKINIDELDTEGNKTSQLNKYIANFLKSFRNTKN